MDILVDLGPVTEMLQNIHNMQLKEWNLDIN